ncbi:MAG: hypothetical protein KGD63_03265 [Candidatus Lokiarchaeota archaeon]|nr:hypothetical protein [Candidatus Lokiarchaeota archaeon]
MSKFKNPNVKKEAKNERKVDENFSYRTVILSAIIAIILLIISILFNGNIVSIVYDDLLLLVAIEIIVKACIILLFFFFMIISVGNYKELTGKPLTWKELIGLFILSLIQSSLDGTVFALTFFGLIFIIIYLYLIQE